MEIKNEWNLGVRRDGDWIQFRTPFTCTIKDGENILRVDHYVWESKPLRVVGKIETDDGPIHLTEFKQD